MRTWVMTIVLLLAVLAVGIALLGCSGAGTSAAQVSGGPLQALAQNQLSAVALVGSWLQILYPPPPSIGACTRTFHSAPLPDGGHHTWGVNSDCSTYDEHWHPDGSGNWVVTLTNGQQDTASWTAVVHEPDRKITTWTETTLQGAHLNYQLTDFAVSPMAPQKQVNSGTVTLADGKGMAFSWTHILDFADILSLGLPDGTKLNFRVPTAYQAGHGVSWPVFTEGATGRLTPPSGVALDLMVTGAGDAWTTWAFRADDGTQGTFSLGTGFSGTGQLRQGGKLVASLQWLTGGAGTLVLLTGSAAAVSPSAAASDFMTDRWLSNSALLGPDPEY